MYKYILQKQGKTCFISYRYNELVKYYSQLGYTDITDFLNNSNYNLIVTCMHDSDIL